MSAYLVGGSSWFHEVHIPGEPPRGYYKVYYDILNTTATDLLINMTLEFATDARGYITGSQYDWYNTITLNGVPFSFHTKSYNRAITKDMYRTSHPLVMSISQWVGKTSSGVLSANASYSSGGPTKVVPGAGKLSISSISTDTGYPRYAVPSTPILSANREVLNANSADSIIATISGDGNYLGGTEYAYLRGVGSDRVASGSGSVNMTLYGNEFSPNSIYSIQAQRYLQEIGGWSPYSNRVNLYTYVKLNEDYLTPTQVRVKRDDKYYTVNTNNTVLLRTSDEVELSLGHLPNPVHSSDNWKYTDNWSSSFTTYKDSGKVFTSALNNSTKSGSYTLNVRGIDGNSSSASKSLPVMIADKSNISVSYSQSTTSYDYNYPAPALKVQFSNLSVGGTTYTDYSNISALCKKVTAVYISIYDSSSESAQLLSRTKLEESSDYSVSLNGAYLDTMDYVSIKLPDTSKLQSLLKTQELSTSGYIIKYSLVTEYDSNTSKPTTGLVDNITMTAKYNPIRVSLRTNPESIEGQNRSHHLYYVVPDGLTDYTLSLVYDTAGYNTRDIYYVVNSSSASTYSVFSIAPSDPSSSAKFTVKVAQLSNGVPEILTLDKDKGEYTYNSTKHTITLSAAPAEGSSVLIQRTDTTVSHYSRPQRYVVSTSIGHQAVFDVSNLLSNLPSGVTPSSQLFRVTTASNKVLSSGTYYESSRCYVLNYNGAITENMSFIQVAARYGSVDFTVEVNSDVSSNNAYMYIKDSVADIGHDNQVARYRRRSGTSITISNIPLTVECQNYPNNQIQILTPKISSLNSTNTLDYTCLVSYKLYVNNQELMYYNYIHLIPPNPSVVMPNRGNKVYATSTSPTASGMSDIMKTIFYWSNIYNTSGYYIGKDMSRTMSYSAGEVIKSPTPDMLPMLFNQYYGCATWSVVSKPGSYTTQYNFELASHVYSHRSFSASISQKSNIMRDDTNDGTTGNIGSLTMYPTIRYSSYGGTTLSTDYYVDDGSRYCNLRNVSIASAVGILNGKEVDILVDVSLNDFMYDKSYWSGSTQGELLFIVNPKIQLEYDSVRVVLNLTDYSIRLSGRTNRDQLITMCNLIGSYCFNPYISGKSDSADKSEGYYEICNKIARGLFRTNYDQISTECTKYSHEYYEYAGSTGILRISAPDDHDPLVAENGTAYSVVSLYIDSIFE